MPQPQERAVLLEPGQVVQGDYGDTTGPPRKHPIKVRLTRSSGGEATEAGVVVVGEQKTTLELYETGLTRQVTTAWGLEWRDRSWGITGVDFEPYKLAPRRFMRLDIEHRET